MNGLRRKLVWEAEGVESSVALFGGDGYSFVVDGKTDGHVFLDAGTQVAGGLLGAFLHLHPKTALVVGLGTGSTAGWLAQVPAIERVDVVELEPAVVRAARDCAAVNRNVLDNPKVKVLAGDAREMLATTRRKYDVIVSEPWKPYRAGAASMFTLEHFRATAARLEDGGVFVQLLRAREVDALAVQSVYATLGSVFPVVETWLTAESDLVMVASMKPLDHDVSRLRQRATEEPYRSAFASAWRVTDLEGVYAHFVARASLAQDVALLHASSAATDDLNRLEHAFARSAGRQGLFSPSHVRQAALARREDRPDVKGGALDWDRFEERRIEMDVRSGAGAQAFQGATPERQRRAEALAAHEAGKLEAALATWREQPREPRSLPELEAIGEALAEAGDEAALPAAEAVRPYFPGEADAIVARLLYRKGKLAEAAEASISAFEGFRGAAFSSPAMLERAMGVALEIGTIDKALGAKLLESLKKPFAASMSDDERLRTVMRLASRIDFARLCADAVRAYEPDVPWRASFLTRRFECYRLTGHPKLSLAAKELDAFFANEPASFAMGLLRAAPPGPMPVPGNVPLGPAATPPRGSARPGAVPAGHREGSPSDDP